MAENPNDKEKEPSVSTVKVFTFAGPEASFGLYQMYGLFAPKAKAAEQHSIELKNDKNQAIKK